MLDHRYAGTTGGTPGAHLKLESCLPEYIQIRPGLGHVHQIGAFLHELYLVCESCISRRDLPWLGILAAE